MAVFQYPPLRGPRSTRLIWLEPSRTFSAPLNCSLSEVILDHNPVFEALSYSWDGDRDRHIYCFNMPLPITRNCEAALRQLRLDKVPRVLWVDSICIDQSSIPDKNLQLPNMREIYQRASEVIIWLGVEKNNSDQVMSQMARSNAGRGVILDTDDLTADNLLTTEGTIDLTLLLARAITSCCLIGILKPLAMFCVCTPTKATSRLTQSFMRPPIFQLMARSVFERMWCVQEAAVAHRIRLVCGSSTCTWEQMIKHLNYAERSNQFMINSAAQYRIFKDRFALQEMLRNIIFPNPGQAAARWPTLSSLIDATRSRGATNPRDKVYALHGVFGLMGLKLPVSDYAKPVNQIYQEITELAFSCDASLDMLYQVTGFSNEHNLPSWVPDLSFTRGPKSPKFDSFRAARSSTPLWRLSPSNNGLCLPGRLVDRIKVRGDAMKPFGILRAEQDDESAGSQTYSTEFSIAAFNTFKQWFSLAQDLPDYPTKQPIQEAFGLTLITNDVLINNVSMSHFLNIYKSWQKFLTDSAAPDERLDNVVSAVLGGDSLMPEAANEQQEFALSMLAAGLMSMIARNGPMSQRASDFHHWLYLILRSKTFFVTEGGFMGIAPDSVQAADYVVLFSGLNTPFVVRDAGRGPARQMSRLIAPAFVLGMMNGELWDDNARLTEFELI